MAIILFLVVGVYFFRVDHVKVTRTTAVYRPKTQTLGGITIVASLIGTILSQLMDNASYLAVLPYAIGLGIPIISAFVLRESIKEGEDGGLSLR